MLSSGIVVNVNSRRASYFQLRALKLAMTKQELLLFPSTQILQQQELMNTSAAKDGGTLGFVKGSAGGDSSALADDYATVSADKTSHLASASTPAPPVSSPNTDSHPSALCLTPVPVASSAQRVSSTPPGIVSQPLPPAPSGEWEIREEVVEKTPGDNPPTVLAERVKSQTNEGEKLGEPPCRADRAPEGAGASSVSVGVFIDSSYQQEIDAALSEDPASSQEPITQGETLALSSRPPTHPPGKSANEDELEDGLLFADENPVTPEESQLVVKAQQADSDGIVFVDKQDGAASNEQGPASGNASDFETLADTPGRVQEKKAESAESLTQPQPQVGDVTVSSDNLHHSMPESEGGQSKSALSTAGGSEINTGGAASREDSAASSDALVASSFSNFSTSLHSPLGEVYADITFSSQEDLVHNSTSESERNGGSVSPTNVCKSFEVCADPAGVISAEERSIISVLEQAIKSEASNAAASETDSALGRGEHRRPHSVPLSPAKDSVPGSKHLNASSTEINEKQGSEEDADCYENVSSKSVCHTRGDVPGLDQTPAEGKTKELNVPLPLESKKSNNLTQPDGKAPEKDKDTGVQIPPTTASDPSNRSGDSGPHGVEPGSGPAGAHPSDPPPHPLSSRDQNTTSVIHGPPVFLVKPYNLPQRREKGVERGPLPEDKGSSCGGGSGEKSKKSSLSHRGFEMFKSMLHISSTAKHAGEKSGAKTAKSLDFGSQQKSPEKSKNWSEDSKKRKRSSPEKSLGSDTKSSKRWSSTPSSTTSHSQEAMKKEKKAETLPKQKPPKSGEGMSSSRQACHSADASPKRWGAPSSSPSHAASDVTEEGQRQSGPTDRSPKRGASSGCKGVKFSTQAAGDDTARDRAVSGTTGTSLKQGGALSGARRAKSPGQAAGDVTVTDRAVSGTTGTSPKQGGTLSGARRAKSPGQAAGDVTAKNQAVSDTTGTGPKQGEVLSVAKRAKSPGQAAGDVTVTDRVVSGTTGTSPKQEGALSGDKRAKSPGQAAGDVTVTDRAVSGISGTSPGQGGALSGARKAKSLGQAAGDITAKSQAVSDTTGTSPKQAGSKRAKSSGEAGGRVTGGNQMGLGTYQPPPRPSPASLQASIDPGCETRPVPPAPEAGIILPRSKPSLTKPPAVAPRPPPASGPNPEARPCGQGLNPLAPPFTMRSSPAGPRPSPGPGFSLHSDFLPASTVTGPSPGPASLPHPPDPSQVRLTLPYTKVGTAGEMGSACGDQQQQQQQHFLSMPFSMVSTDSMVGIQGEEGWPVPPQSLGGAAESRTSFLTSALRHTFFGRRARQSSQEAFPGAPVAQHHLRIPLAPPVFLQAPYRTLQANLDGAGFQHGGDGALGAQSLLLGAMQKSLKEEMENRAVAGKTVVDACGEGEKVSEGGEGDAVRQVAPPVAVKEQVLDESKNVAGIQKPPKNSKSGESQKHMEATPLPKATATPASAPPFDLNLAREAWRTAWRTSNVADTESCESSLAEDARRPTGQACVPILSAEPGAAASRVPQGDGHGAAAVQGPADEAHPYQNVPEPQCRTVRKESREAGKSKGAGGAGGGEAEDGYVNMRAQNPMKKKGSYVDMQPLKEALALQASAVDPPVLQPPVLNQTVPDACPAAGKPGDHLESELQPEAHLTVAEETVSGASGIVTDSKDGATQPLFESPSERPSVRDENVAKSDESPWNGKGLDKPVESDNQALDSEGVGKCAESDNREQSLPDLENPMAARDNPQYTERFEDLAASGDKPQSVVGLKNTAESDNQAPDVEAAGCPAEKAREKRDKQDTLTARQNADTDVLHPSSIANIVGHLAAGDSQLSRDRETDSIPPRPPEKSEEQGADLEESCSPSREAYPINSPTETASDGLRSVYDTSLKKTQFVELSYHVSDGFETLRDEDTVRSYHVSDGFKMVTEGDSLNNAESSAHVPTTNACDTIASTQEISEPPGSQSSVGALAQEEYRAECRIFASTLVPLAQASRGSNGADTTSASIGQTSHQSMGNNESSGINQASDAHSVDVTPCDSVISAHWEACLQSSSTDAASANPSSGVGQQPADTVASNEVVTSCDSGISAGELTQSATDVLNQNIEVTQSGTSVSSLVVEVAQTAATGVLSAAGTSLPGQLHACSGFVDLTSQDLPPCSSECQPRDEQEVALQATASTSSTFGQDSDMGSKEMAEKMDVEQTEVASAASHCEELATADPGVIPTGCEVMSETATRDPDTGLARSEIQPETATSDPHTGMTRHEITSEAAVTEGDQVYPSVKVFVDQLIQRAAQVLSSTSPGQGEDKEARKEEEEEEASSTEIETEKNDQGIKDTKTEEASHDDKRTERGGAEDGSATEKELAVNGDASIEKEGTVKGCSTMTEKGETICDGEGGTINDGDPVTEKGEAVYDGGAVTRKERTINDGDTIAEKEETIYDGDAVTRKGGTIDDGGTVTEREETIIDGDPITEKEESISYGGAVTNKVGTIGDGDTVTEKEGTIYDGDPITEKEETIDDVDPVIEQEKTVNDGDVVTEKEGVMISDGDTGTEKDETMDSGEAETRKELTVNAGDTRTEKEEAIDLGEAEAAESSPISARATEPEREEEVSDTEPEKEEVSDTGTEKEEVSDIGTEKEEVGDTEPKREKVGDTEPEREVVSDSGTEKEEVGDTEPEREEVGDIEPKREVVSDAGTEKEEVGDTEPEREEVGDTEPEREEVSDTEPESEEVGDTGTEKEEAIDLGETKVLESSSISASDTEPEREEVGDTGTENNEDGDTETEQEEASDRGTEKEEVGDTGTEKEEAIDLDETRVRENRPIDAGDTGTERKEAIDLGETKAEKDRPANAGDTRTEKETISDCNDLKAEKEQTINDGDIRTEKEWDTRTDKETISDGNDLKAEKEQAINDGETRTEDAESIGSGDTEADNGEAVMDNTSTEKEETIIVGDTSTEKEETIIDGDTNAEKEEATIDGDTNAEKEEAIIDGDTNAEKEEAINDGDTNAEKEDTINDGDTSIEKEEAIYDVDSNTEKEEAIIDGDTRIDKEEATGCDDTRIAEQKAIETNGDTSAEKEEAICGNTTGTEKEEAIEDGDTSAEKEEAIAGDAGTERAEAITDGDAGTEKEEALAGDARTERAEAITDVDARTEKDEAIAGDARTERAEAITDGETRTERAEAITDGDARTERAEATTDGDARTEKEEAIACDARTERAEAITDGDARTERAEAITDGETRTEKEEATGGGGTRTEKAEPVKGCEAKTEKGEAIGAGDTGVKDDEAVCDAETKQKVKADIGSSTRKEDKADDARNQMDDETREEKEEASIDNGQRKNEEAIDKDDETREEKNGARVESGQGKGEEEVNINKDRDSKEEKRDFYEDGDRGKETIGLPNKVPGEVEMNMSSDAGEELEEGLGERDAGNRQEDACRDDELQGNSSNKDDDRRKVKEEMLKGHSTQKEGREISKDWNAMQEEVSEESEAGKEKEDLCDKDGAGEPSNSRPGVPLLLATTMQHNKQEDLDQHPDGNLAPTAGTTPQQEDVSRETVLNQQPGLEHCGDAVRVAVGEQVAEQAQATLTDEEKHHAAATEGGLHPSTGEATGTDLEDKVIAGKDGNKRVHQNVDAASSTEVEGKALVGLERHENLCQNSSAATVAELKDKEHVGREESSAVEHVGSDQEGSEGFEVVFREEEGGGLGLLPETLGTTEEEAVCGVSMAVWGPVGHQEGEVNLLELP